MVSVPAQIKIEGEIAWVPFGEGELLRLLDVMPADYEFREFRKELLNAWLELSSGAALASPPVAGRRVGKDYDVPLKRSIQLPTLRRRAGRRSR